MRFGELAADVVVIGAGQAGLSATFHLKRRGVDHLTLDASTAPGGAWLQSWDTLTVESLNSIFGLPLSVPRLSPRRRKLPPRSPPISRTSSGACF
ncbi:NAD(P)-binding protein [Corynebacterium sanguinis]|uniref:NAD(P)-binding protein n=1 Tax=Corynebacterium sanguinis TaxID=2594913 RepID=UPI0040572978